MNGKREIQTGKRVTGILLAVIGVLACIISLACGSLAALLGQGRTEPAPALIVLFIIAALVSITSLVLIIIGAVLIANPAGKKTTPPMRPG